MKLPLIYLEWEDAMSRSSWIDDSDLEAWSKDGFYVCQVGWVLKETSKFIMLASRRNPESEWGQTQWGNIQRIPKTWIRNRRKLK